MHNVAREEIKTSLSKMSSEKANIGREYRTDKNDLENIIYFTHDIYGGGDIYQFVVERECEMVSMCKKKKYVMEYGKGTSNSLNSGTCRIGNVSLRCC